MSSWSGRSLDMDCLVQDLMHVMRELKIKRAALAGHCLSAVSVVLRYTWDICVDSHS